MQSHARVFSNGSCSTRHIRHQPGTATPEPSHCLLLSSRVTLCHCKAPAPFAPRSPACVTRAQPWRGPGAFHSAGRVLLSGALPPSLPSGANASEQADREGPSHSFGWKQPERHARGQLLRASLVFPILAKAGKKPAWTAGPREVALQRNWKMPILQGHPSGF